MISSLQRIQNFASAARNNDCDIVVSDMVLWQPVGPWVPRPTPMGYLHMANIQHELLDVQQDIHFPFPDVEIEAQGVPLGRFQASLEVSRLGVLEPKGVLIRGPSEDDDEARPEIPALENLVCHWSRDFASADRLGIEALPDIVYSIVSYYAPLFDVGEALVLRHYSLDFCTNVLRRWDITATRLSEPHPLFMRVAHRMN